MDSELDTDTDTINITQPNCEYLLKNRANQDILVSEIKSPIIHILCYHVTSKSAKYPFIQIMLELERHPSDKFVLPSVYMVNVKTNLSSYVLNQIKHNLEELGCDASVLNEESFLGLININNTNNTNMFLVDISAVDIFRISNTKLNSTWFALPTEIINIQSICNIPIDSNLNRLFLSSPELGMLHNPETNEMYPLPDAVYSGSHFKQVEFNSVFGVPRKQVYASCGEYFYFHRIFEDAVREGGWDISETKISELTNEPSILTDNEYGRYIRGGINRYALFPGNYATHIEKTNRFSLTDNIINGFLDSKDTIVIQYKNEELDTILPDLLVKEYESFLPISYHMLNKNILGDKYSIDNQDKYSVL